jgi:hypothetical protein
MIEDLVLYKGVYVTKGELKKIKISGEQEEDLTAYTLSDALEAALKSIVITSDNLTNYWQNFGNILAELSSLEKPKKDDCILHEGEELKYVDYDFESILDLMREDKNK